MSGPRGRAAAAGRQGRQPGALDDQRHRAGDLDHHRVGLGESGRPQARTGDRDGAGVLAPLPQGVGAGERDDRGSAVVADQRRQRHLGFLLGPVLVGLGQHGHDGNEQPGRGDGAERRVLGGLASPVGGENRRDGGIGIPVSPAGLVGLARTDPTLPPAPSLGGGTTPLHGRRMATRCNEIDESCTLPWVMSIRARAESVEHTCRIWEPHELRLRAGPLTRLDVRTRGSGAKGREQSSWVLHASQRSLRGYFPARRCGKSYRRAWSGRTSAGSAG